MGGGSVAAHAVGVVWGKNKGLGIVAFNVALSFIAIFLFTNIKELAAGLLISPV